MGFEANFSGGLVNVTGYPAALNGQLESRQPNVTVNPNFTVLDGTTTTTLGQVVVRFGSLAIMVFHWSSVIFQVDKAVTALQGLLLKSRPPHSIKSKLGLRRIWVSFSAWLRWSRSAKLGTPRLESTRP
jgi:hypothetical protein